jgi:hypothetical protein
LFVGVAPIVAGLLFRPSPYIMLRTVFATVDRAKNQFKEIKKKKYV